MKRRFRLGSLRNACLRGLVVRRVVCILGLLCFLLLESGATADEGAEEADIAVDVPLLASVVNLDEFSPRVSYDCDPCLERSGFTIRAIVHGTKNDPFWRPVAIAMRQVANDMRINLEIRGLASTSFDEEQMVRDIETTIELDNNDSEHVNALVVTIPTRNVQVAVQKAIDSGLPVFALNSGFDLDMPGLLGHVAMDDWFGGEKAGEEFLRAWGNETTASTPRRVLYINHDKGNGALHLRMRGAASVLNGTATVGEFAIDPNDSRVQAQLDALLQFCPFDGIMLPGGIVLEQVLFAYYKNKCSFERQVLGTFDTNLQIYDAIAVAKVTFTISQQPYIQASLPIVMAALYATTGKSLLPHALKSFKGNYQSGPKVITLSELPPDSQQVCESEAFPVCSFAGDDDRRGRCDCKDRSRIRIGAVLPENPFWDPIWEAANQASIDMGVELMLDVLESPDDLETANVKTAEKVKSLCQDGVDGLMTTIKSDEVFEAIRVCQELNVPVVSINSGEAYAKKLGLSHHIAMNDYAAGYLAGEAMLKAGMKIGYCINYFVVNSLSLRCDGFRHAINNATATDAVYIGTIAAPADNAVLFQQVVEATIGIQESEDWEDIGVLLVSTRFVSAALKVKERRTEVILGCFDESKIVHDALDDSLLLFGIDQQPYLQGYLPVLLLTWLSHTKQPLLSQLLETGPKLIQESPSAYKATCEVSNFEVCPRQPSHNQLDAVRPIGLTFVAIISATSSICMVWVYWNRKTRTVRVSQPFFLVLICLGTIIMGATIIPMSLDDGILAKNGGCVGCDCPSCDIACMASPWLFTVGFTIVFASLFSKVWRVNRVMHSSRGFRRVTVLARDVMIPFSLLLGLNVAFMLVWTLVDPMYWDRSRKCGSDDFTSFGACHIGSDQTSVAMAVSVGVVNSLAILLANYEAYKARNISTEFSESRYIGFSMLSILQVSMVGVPLIFLVRENPPAQFFVQAGVIAVVCMSVLLLIFMPKISAANAENKVARAARRGQQRYMYDHKSSSRVGANQNGDGVDMRRRAPSSSSGQVSPHEVAS